MSVVYYKLFSINPKWADFHSMFYDNEDRILTDETGNYTLKLDMYTESGILKNNNNDVSFLLNFKIPNKKADELGTVSLTAYKAEEPQNFSAYGRYEYREDSEDTIYIWIDGVSTDSDTDSALSLLDCFIFN